MSRAEYYEALADRWGGHAVQGIRHFEASYGFTERDRDELVDNVRMAAHFGLVALSSKERGR